MDAAVLRPPQAAIAATACAHCGRPVVAPGERYCCPGCAAARAVVEGLGLGAFYVRRLAAADGRPLTPVEPDRDFAPWAREEAGGVCRLDLMVDGLSCPACMWLIERVLAADPTVLDGRVDLGARRLRLRWRGPASRADELALRVSRLGFALAPWQADEATTADRREERGLLVAMAVAGFAAANTMLLSVSVWSGHDGGMGEATRDLLHWVSAAVALPAIAFSGRPFFASAFAAVRAGRTNMDVPIAIGVCLAAGMSLAETIRSGEHAYFDSAITLLFFLLIGRWLDRRARQRARAAAERLLALRARHVTVLDDDGIGRPIAPDAVRAGDRVLVAAGERIGVDGTVESGVGEIDRSLVTGESLPAPAGPGDAVFAGTLNLGAPLTVRAGATGEGTLLAEIARSMEVAEQARGRYVALADRVSRAYAPVVHLAALATLLGWVFLADSEWQPALLKAVAVLIITCPCALGLAVPVVQVVAVGRLMRRGVLVKSATALERLRTVDTVVFDKTGTLTVGRPVLVADPTRPAAALEAAAGLARASKHPLARALAAASPPGPAAAGVVERPGEGLLLAGPDGEIRLGSRMFCGVGPEGPPADGPELWLRRPDGAPWRFAFRDALRPDAAECIAALRRRGLRVVLLSGDRQETVAAVAAALGIAEAAGELSPTAKAERLAALRAAGRRVLMVGDGLNDGPALAGADASMSPADALDVAQTAADIVFQGERLAPVVETLDVARRAGRLTAQNIAFAVLYNFLAVPLAVFGFATPLVAAAAMSSSSVAVIANASRLAR